MQRLRIFRSETNMASDKQHYYAMNKNIFLPPYITPLNLSKHLQNHDT